ncbi:MAG: hypothetical protein SF053_08920 [Bacteroidia bacterium]|nr:hypothetical protein [Bacteroidia bacterium]
MKVLIFVFFVVLIGPASLLGQGNTGIKDCNQSPLARGVFTTIQVAGGTSFSGYLYKPLLKSIPRCNQVMIAQDPRGDGGSINLGDFKGYAMSYEYKSALYIASTDDQNLWAYVSPTILKAEMINGQLFIDGEPTDITYWSCFKQEYKERIGQVGNCEWSDVGSCLTTLGPETLVCLGARCGYPVVYSAVRASASCALRK